MKIKEEKGFTLIEMLLVVLVLAIIAGISIPNFKGTYSGMQLKNEVDQLTYLMRYAQSRAVIKNAPMQVVFISNNRQYRLLQKKEDEFEKFSSRMGRLYSVSDKISITAQKDHINFYPDGSIDKERVDVCSDKKCFIISTREQRGYVNVYQKK